MHSNNRQYPPNIRPARSPDARAGHQTKNSQCKTDQLWQYDMTMQWMQKIRDNIVKSSSLSSCVPINNLTNLLYLLSLLYLYLILVLLDWLGLRHRQTENPGFLYLGHACAQQDQSGHSKIASKSV